MQLISCKRIKNACRAPEAVKIIPLNSKHPVKLIDLNKMRRMSCINNLYLILYILKYLQNILLSPGMKADSRFINQQNHLSVYHWLMLSVPYKMRGTI
ncbi:MAG: hypothetical protein MZV63_12330 [Marinilabiliales bacterium]|nr:hypothetical protein [Marinilabiliales bacterium]